MKAILNWFRLRSWALGVLLRNGWPGDIVHFAAGLGDELLCTAVVREMRRRGLRRPWVLSNYPEIYRENGDVAAVLAPDPRLIHLARRLGRRVIEPRYSRHLPDGNMVPPPAHLLKCMLATAGLTGEVTLRAQVSLTPDEIAAARPWRGHIVFQAAVRSAGRPNTLKEYPAALWQEVLDGLGGRHPIVQLGGAADPLLRGVTDMRGRTTLREAAAMLHGARLFLGLESGLMHLARAVDCPAVIVFGGRVAPAQAGYSAFANISRSPPCAPCWKYEGCEYQRRCLTEIPPSEVVARVEAALRAPREPLPEESASISPEEAALWCAMLPRNSPD